MANKKTTNNGTIDTELDVVEENVEKEKIAMFSIGNVFLQDLYNSIGTLAYNFSFKTSVGKDELTMNNNTFIELVEDYYKQGEVDINALNFICNTLMAYPYNVIKDVVNKIKVDQSYYFTEREPKDLVI